MFSISTLPSMRHAAAVVILATAATLPQATDAQDKKVNLDRPSCKECSETRKKLDGAKARIEKNKKRQREEILNANEFRRLDKQNDAKRKEVSKAFGDLQRNCRNGCPASVPIKVKPVKPDGTCKACEKTARELADIRTRIKQVQAEQDYIKSMGRQVSIKGNNDTQKQLVRLKGEESRLNLALIDCEKKNCRKKKTAEKTAKQPAGGRKTPAIDEAVTNIKRKIEEDNRKKRKSGGD